MIEEKIVFPSGSDRLSGLFRAPVSPQPSPVLIICHAYGEGKEAYDEMTAFLLTKGIASLVFDFHGHGESEGARVSS
jgi:alpha-beta hydrolase superfamily lysophospholipase